jgi:hypothetical protein
MPLSFARRPFGDAYVTIGSHPRSGGSGRTPIAQTQGDVAVELVTVLAILGYLAPLNCQNFLQAVWTCPDKPLISWRHIFWLDFCKDLKGAAGPFA